MTQFAETLALRREQRLTLVREYQVLRVAAEVGGGAGSFPEGRRQVLAWAQKRCGRPLPKPAWEGAPFDLPAAGRAVGATRLDGDDGTEVWALRVDDPDKEVAGRIWTTEVVLGLTADQRCLTSLRLSMTTREEQPQYAPAVPGLLRQLADRCGLTVSRRPLRTDAWRVHRAADAEALIAWLADPARRLPVIVAAADGQKGEDPDRPLIDPDALAPKTLGLAEVVVLSAKQSYALSDAFGKIRSVYRGALRIYHPGFDGGADPYEHPLILGDAVRADPEGCAAWLCRVVAAASLRRWLLGRDVLTFAAVRSAALRAEQERQRAAGAGDRALFEQAMARIDQLEKELASARDQIAQALDLAATEEERAQAAEARARGAEARVQDLLERLRSAGVAADAEDEVPAGWTDFAAWCDRTLAGRLVLAPAARRNVKKPAFRDPAQAARCLRWLATVCRDRRLHGGGTLDDAVVEPGIRNAPCGADAFPFDFDGRRLTAAWHVKNGGNTRDPERCLRIYYAWDEQTRQIVVADMPAHRVTGAS